VRADIALNSISFVPADLVENDGAAKPLVPKSIILDVPFDKVKLGAVPFMATVENVGVVDVAKVIDPVPFVTDMFVPAVKVAFVRVFPVVLPISN
jgi:hypothetical protein